MANKTKKLNRGQQKILDMRLHAEVRDLIARHSAGDVEAGNRAFQIGDKLARELSCSQDLNDLCDAWTKHGYRPTIRADLGVRYEILAEIYDYAQARRGNSVKAYRG